MVRIKLDAESTAIAKRLIDKEYAKSVTEAVRLALMLAWLCPKLREGLDE